MCYGSVSTRHLRHIVTELRRIFEEGRPYQETNGLCMNMVRNFHDPNGRDKIMHALKLAFARWPKFSGYVDWPVPSEEHAPANAYRLTCNLWDKGTEYGRNRWELAKFLLDEFSAELERRGAALAA